MKRILFFLSTAMLLYSCGGSEKHLDENDVTLKFDSTWNIYERCTLDENENIVYNAIPWGGLVGTFLDKNMPVDLSGYESITFQFAQPVSVPVQIVVANRFKTVGKKGVSSLTCYFDGQDVTSVNEIVLQASDSCDIIVTDVFLTPGNAKWEATPIWTGQCSFGSWADGFIVKPEFFADAVEGNKIEFIFNTDRSDPDVTYWLFKTIYDGTTDTLEGNDRELNEWGCASIGENATTYRILLTANDVKNLKEHGMFVNGYNINVSQVNLLRRVEPTDMNI